MTNIGAIRLAVLVAIGCFSRTGYSQVTVNVMAQTRISALVQHQAERTDCVIQGTLADELGNLLPNQELQLRTESTTPGDLGPTPTLTTCDENGVVETSEKALSLRTNDGGKFCVRVRDCKLAPGASLAIAFAGGSGYEAATARVSLNASHTMPTLTVLEGPSRIALDGPPLSIAVQLSAQAHTTGSLDVSLSLLNSAFRENKTQEKAIATTKTDSTGIARFSIARELLGAPGPCQLRAQFLGSKDLEPASIVWPILRTCSVQLQAHLEQAAMQVGDTVSIEVAAISGCGTVVDGSLEFALNRKPEAAIPVRGGHAQWHLSTFDLAPGEYTLFARYVPSTAGFVAGSPQSLVFQLMPVSVQRRALWWMSGGLVVLWFVWRYVRRNAKPRDARQSTKGMAKPQSLEVEPSTTPEFGWIGTVFDSHTGAPIAGAAVTVVVPSFDGIHTELDATTSTEGAFKFPASTLASQSKLSVSAPGYLRAEWPMPRPGKLMVRLETRRRAVIRSFVQWADKSLPRLTSVPEPTPADVQLAAQQHSLAQVQEWAKHVERAAFGPDPTAPNSDAIPEPPPISPLGTRSRK